MTTIKTIALVGLGVVGGSFAYAIRQTYQDRYQVIGIDIDQATIKDALEQGLLDQGYSHAQGIQEGLSQADLVIISIYPSYIIDFMSQYGPYFKAGAIVTDTTGVKGDLSRRLLPVIPDKVDFIFGHPMAGREKKGLAYADPSVFVGANYIMTPGPLNQMGHIQFLHDFILDLGFKRVTLTEADHHDQMIAHTSQLSHILAVALINSDHFPDQTAAYVGDSYRDLTRIANMNAPLWADLFEANDRYLLENIQAFQDQLQILKEAIESKDRPVLVERMEEATRRRLGLESQDQRIKG